MMSFEKVTNVYSGIDGRCCCGCAGKHYYSSAVAEKATKARKYEVAVSDRMVRKVYNILAANSALVEKISNDCESVVIGRRLYIVYASSDLQ